MTPEREETIRQAWRDNSDRAMHLFGQGHRVVAVLAMPEAVPVISTEAVPTDEKVDVLHFRYIRDHVPLGHRVRIVCEGLTVVGHPPAA